MSLHIRPATLADAPAKVIIDEVNGHRCRNCIATANH